MISSTDFGILWLSSNYLEQRLKKNTNTRLYMVFDKHKKIMRIPTFRKLVLPSPSGRELVGPRVHRSVTRSSRTRVFLPEENVRTLLQHVDDAHKVLIFIKAFQKPGQNKWICNIMPSLFNVWMRTGSAAYRPLAGFRIPHEQRIL